MTHAHEEERLRIARELHDDTAQELVNLVRRLERLQEDANQRAGAHTRDSVELARSILRGVRRYSQSLRPPVLDDLGLSAAIETVVDDLSQRLPSGAHLQVTGTPRRLPGDAELTLFRIAQEALRNVEKHARAKSATVSLHFDRQVVLTIADDGRGFGVPNDLSSLARAGCFGVVGMRERAELFGARFAIESKSGSGTTVHVALEA